MISIHYDYCTLHIAYFTQYPYIVHDTQYYNGILDKRLKEGNREAAETVIKTLNGSSLHMADQIGTFN
jgi:hypothetical protein